jgi:DNA-binding transcriptional LysR family regulator
MIEPRRLLTFREVAHHRSFSRAAEALALTQPAVSQHVRALETQLGSTLIRRGAGGFALTPAGELLLVHADAVADRLALAERQLGEAAQSERARLRVGVFPSALATLVPAAIGRLADGDGPAGVEIGEATAAEAAAGVRDGSLHVGLCFQDTSHPRREHVGTERQDLLDEPMLAGLGRRHPLAVRERLHLRELADEPWLAATRDGLIVRACREAGFEPRLAYVTSDPLAIGELVAAGRAVTLVSRLLAPRLPGVATAALEPPFPRRSIYALTPVGRVHPLVPPFLDALRSEADSATTRARQAASATTGRNAT